MKKTKNNKKKETVQVPVEAGMSGLKPDHAGTSIHLALCRQEEELQLLQLILLCALCTSLTSCRCSV